VRGKEDVEMGGGGVIEKNRGFVPDFDRLPGVATRLENSPKLADLHGGTAFFLFFSFLISFFFS